MTRPTITELRAALDAQADDIPPAEDVLASATRRRAPHHRGLLIAAAVVLTLAAGVLVAVLRGGSDEQPAKPPTWRTYHSAMFGFSVEYPSNWRAVHYDEVSTMFAAVVFIGDQPMSAPCHEVTNGQTCGTFVRHVAPGGVTISWFNTGMPGLTLDKQPGTSTRIGGHAAKVQIGNDAECTRIGGQTSVIASVERTGGNLFQMSACVAAPRDSKQVAQVLQSLRSMRQE